METSCGQKKVEQGVEGSALQPAHAIVLAVAHRTYNEWTLEDWQKLLLPGAIVTDVKNVVPTEDLEQAGHHVWRM